MIKKLPLTIFLLTIVFLTQSFAQNDVATEKQLAIKELVALINADDKAQEIIDLFSAQLDEMQDATIKSLLNERTDLTANDKKSLEEMLLSDRKNSIRRFQDKLAQKINYSEMMREISAIVYDKNYTLEEIRDLTAFYRTPTGQKSLKQIAPVLTDTMQLVQERLLPKIPIIMKEIEIENRQEIEQKINARKPKPKTKSA